MAISQTADTKSYARGQRERKQNQQEPIKIFRNYKRGIRSEVATTRRKIKHLTQQSGGRREYRKQEPETSREDWRRSATKARQLAEQPPKKAFKDESNDEQQNSPKNTTHTRARKIRSMSKHTAHK